MLARSAIKGEVELKEWVCERVKHHKDLGQTIEEWKKNGWCLHTYQASGHAGGPGITH